MKNSDLIQMTQCGVYSIAFPTDNLVETLDTATFETKENSLKVELLKNPITGKVVQILEKGFFFSMRVTYQKLSKEMVSAKIYELKQKLERMFDAPRTEREWADLAKFELYEVLPLSSEIINFFYSPETELLFTNKTSKHSKFALNQLVHLFGSVGVKSIIVSDEKLGLNTKLTQYLEQNTPLFKFLHFQNEATLINRTDNDETFLTCRHLNNDEGKQKALTALQQGYQVQSMAVLCEEDNLAVRFKLDHTLKIRSMKFSQYAELARCLNSPHFAGKAQALTDYLDRQLAILIKIARCTVLEFVSETKLEKFV